MKDGTDIDVGVSRRTDGGGTWSITKGITLIYYLHIPLNLLPTTMILLSPELIKALPHKRR